MNTPVNTMQRRCRDAVARIVCKYHNTTLQDMRDVAGIREERYVIVRHQIYYFLKTKTSLTLHQAAEVFGQDHSTVINAVKQLNNRIDTNRIFRQEVEELSRRIDYRLDRLETSYQTLNAVRKLRHTLDYDELSEKLILLPRAELVKLIQNAIR